MIVYFVEKSGVRDGWKKNKGVAVRERGEVTGTEERMSRYERVCVGEDDENESETRMKT